MHIGETATLTKTITDADVRAFADLSGDHNPLHLDDAYAKTTRFGARIAHGAFSFGLLSAVLGNQLPGNGTVYLKQDLKFLKPVLIDDTITATVEITAIRADKGIVTLKTSVTNQRGEAVAEGEAVVLHESARTASE
jgi:3-hydroxybutyryl-CoA dehydratase